MGDIKTVGIISKPDSSQAFSVVPELCRWLRDRNIEIRCDTETAKYAEGIHGIPREQVPDGTQFIIVLGGDGTLLSAARAVEGREIPIFAVNLGGLGFLTAITVDNLYPELEQALAGNYRIGARRMIQCELQRGGRTISTYQALNDVVLTKAALARMIDVEARVEQHFVCRYKSDGLIVSTPTGSTAYSLSAGGPILFPTVSCFSLTPICPHMLTNRPVIVPDTFTVDLYNLASDNDAMLTIDGQVGEPLQEGDHVLCHRSEYAVHLIRPPTLMFFDVLREKLKWGER